MTQQLEFDLFANSAPLAGRFLPAASLEAGHLEEEFEAETDLDSTGVDDETLENAVPRPLAPESVVPTDTLQDVIDWLRGHEDLTPGRRRDLISSIRTMARLLARPPEHIGAHLPALRKALAAASPASAELSTKRLANVKADVSAALKLFGALSAKRRLGRELSAEWQVLSLACPNKAIRWRLSRFMRWCSEEGVLPAEADASTLDRFIAEVDVSFLAIDPPKLQRQIITAWSSCARTVPDWPTQTLGAPAPERAWALSWAELPATLRADTEIWIARLAGHDLLAEEGPIRPLRPATLRHHREQVRLAASALIRSGGSMADTSSLANLTSAEAVRTIVRYLLDRYGGPTRTVYFLAICLKAIARHHVKRAERELAALGGICRRLNAAPSGLTRKNRDRLRPFDDQHRMDLLLTLPNELMRRARMPGRDKRAAARDARNAVAIEILLTLAPRLGNLANLRLGKHVLIDSARRDRVVVAVERNETKNGSVIDAELPPESGRLLRLYVERYLPALARSDNDHLFPGRSGGAIERSSLAKQITAAIHRTTGCLVNPHLFRHLGAKGHLDAHPGEYETVRRVLGHKSIDVTTNHYAGLESAAAARHFDAGVLERRRTAEHRLQCCARKR